MPLRGTRLAANLHQQPTRESKIAQSDFVKALTAARNRYADVHGATCAKLTTTPDANADPSRDARPLNHRAVVLSGGSMRGAFGAGFLLGLQDIGQLPDSPEVITGISTGALQATFLFLAKQPVAADRTYEWLNPQVATMRSLPGSGRGQPLTKRSSQLGDLALAYSITAEKQILNRTHWSGLMGQFWYGSAGRLDPLRKRLMALISRETLRQVAVEACHGRVLLVGVTDFDDGYGYAIDMTELALDAYDGDASPKRIDAARATYVSTLLASSSVPGGAMPVTLRYRAIDVNGMNEGEATREHMFIDGGARYGVFLPNLSDGYDVTLLVNNGLAIEPATPGNPDLPTNKWSLYRMLERTAEDILETQVYQLSVGQVEYGAKTLRMAYLSGKQDMGGSPDMDAPDDHIYDAKSCRDWFAQDKKTAKPLQFYPNYMACVIDYGRKRGNLMQWNLKSQAAPDAIKSAPLQTNSRIPLPLGQ
ncbi:patatin-like phospholipase family protein [Novosphingobium sp. FSY-8]|uniref:Patatin-like phospholipase family protein n=1 Tax=Novosphingobium ovatum TaxID=1908523 RepID=A0ABW9XCT1_9SPHN|nr:patatin-like phospholipase family protein [Novosphingobium ovatum]NBC36349.1 patatin-like phospholipase family protein [Novosphingobium ovatum]